MFALDGAWVAALHHAAFNGNTECARILIEAGVDINAVDAHGQTPLYLAVVGGWERTVRLRSYERLAKALL